MDGLGVEVVGLCTALGFTVTDMVLGFKMRPQLNSLSLPQEAGVSLHLPPS